ncbi:DNA/RNA helicase domain-containing protein [Nonlabens antarcticus]|uniref:DNA/RNA helicase domain-containing protein n=1 Tax=Nonlabens antarcticus TaxID=392714 RepID=UPI0018917431|nr:DNA/RNA helicase domain-containing protein [Nonlabens antarcticus]
MAYNFQLPIITDLTGDQQSVLNYPGAVAVSGGPGTGKSVIGLWRHIRNYDTGSKKSLLLTYTVSLERFLTETCRTLNNNAAQNVNRTFRFTTGNGQQHYDEIIVDEAQDVNLEKYNIIRRFSKSVSYTTDDNQILYPNQCTRSEQLREIFNNQEYTLHTNFRNTREITRFVRSLFPDHMIQDGNSTGPIPQLIHLDNDEDDQIQAIIDIINTYPDATHNIAILDPFQGSVRSLHSKLSDKGINCSFYVNEEEELTSIERVHVTTFKSCKGLEFNTIIVPNFSSYTWWLRERPNIVTENDIYVVLTRSKNNVFLLDRSYSNYRESNMRPLATSLSRGTLEEEDYVADNNNTITTSRSNTNTNIVEEEDDLPF